MHVHVDTARRDDLSFTGDYLGAWSDDDGDPRLGVRIAGFADRYDSTVFDADVSLHDSPVIEDQRIRDHRVDRAIGSRALRLSHTVTDDFAAPELHLLAVGREVLLDLDDEVRIRKSELVADRRPEHVRVRRAAHLMGHDISSLTVPGSRLGLLATHPSLAG